MYVYNILASWWILPLSIMKCPSLSLFVAFVLTSIWSDISIATLAIFPSPFAWNIFFQSFTFSLCRSFVPRWVSCRQHMYGSCFLILQLPCVFWLEQVIHLHLRLLLIGTYSLPFFSFCTCVPLCLTLYLRLRAVPLASLAMLVWWSCILLIFFCLGNSLFCLPF